MGEEGEKLTENPERHAERGEAPLLLHYSLSVQRSGKDASLRSA